MRHVATALTIFGAGFVAGMLVPRAQQGAGCLGRRLAAPADLQASTLEDALGITPAVVRAIREEVRSMKLRPQSALKQHYKSRSILQDVFVRLHQLLFKAHLLPLTGWGVGRGIVQTNSTPAWMRHAAAAGHARPGAYHAGPSVLTRFAWNEV